jgi:hypothetical protein
MVEFTDKVTVPCFNEYVRPHFMAYCRSELIAKSKSSGWALDCNCFAQEVTKLFATAKKAPNQTLSKDRQKRETENSFRKCARR